MDLTYKYFNDFQNEKKKKEEKEVSKTFSNFSFEFLYFLSSGALSSNS